LLLERLARESLALLDQTFINHDLERPRNRICEGVLNKAPLGNTEKINAAINAIVEQAQETEDSKSILTIGITAKWDLDGQSVVVSMPVNVRHKFSRTATMDDPNQPKLPLVESEDWGKTKIGGER